MTEVILYTTEGGRSQIKLRAQEQTVWLTQLEMAELFDATKQSISLHLKNVFADGELAPAATVNESLTVQIEVGRLATHVAADHFRGATKMIEVGSDSTCREFRQVQREVARNMAFYNLDMILSVGFGKGFLCQSVQLPPVLPGFSEREILYALCRESSVTPYH